MVGRHDENQVRRVRGQICIGEVDRRCHLGCKARWEIQALFASLADGSKVMLQGATGERASPPCTELGASLHRMNVLRVHSWQLRGTP